MAPDELAILKLTTFERVFSDVQAAMANVPANASSINSALGIKLDQDALSKLETACQERTTLARRLRRIASSTHLRRVTADSLREKLEAHGLPRDQLGDGGEIELTDEEDVRVLLDILEQLYYEADFTGEHRRADRYSARP